MRPNHSIRLGFEAEIPPDVARSQSPAASSSNNNNSNGLIVAGTL
jgi:hypothetical protein